MGQSTTTEIRDRIKSILQRDLKVGPAASIPDDLPLIGGTLDLDSLDVLLLVTSLEKTFGIKFPNSAVGESAFANLTTLTDYVARQLQQPAAAGGSHAAEAIDFLARLPHRDPFRCVSEVNEIRPGESASGAWTLTGKEPFFAGHFPGQPLVPGVLLAEALAQLSGLVAPPAASASPLRTLAHVDVRFKQPVAPPARIELRSRLARALGDLHQFEVCARIDGTPVAEGAITLHCPGDGDTKAGA